MTLNQIRFVAPKNGRKFGCSNVYITRNGANYKIKFAEADSIVNKKTRVKIGFVDDRMYFVFINELDTCSFKLCNVSKDTRTVYASVAQTTFKGMMLPTAKPLPLILDGECGLYYCKLEG